MIGFFALAAFIVADAAYLLFGPSVRVVWRRWRGQHL